MTSPACLVVALDFSASSSSVVDYAWQVAAASGAEIHFVHIVPRSLFTQESSPSNTDAMLQALQMVTGLPHGRDATTVTVKHHVGFGTPAREIIDYAREYSAGTIIIGSSIRSRLSQMVLGSVAATVLRDAPCAVLIVPENPQPDSGNEESQQHPDEVSSQESTPAKATHRRPAGSNRVVELLERALQWRATDIHIDPLGSDRVWIRFRVDGKLRTFCRLDVNLAAPLLMQLKLMADFDTTQTFSAQEGRLRLPASLGSLEVRVTMVPACDGDAVALRLLSHSTLPRPLSTLGMSPATLHTVNDMLHQREGLILVTGPTGSGKTTTVYAMLESLGYGDRNIVSIEDPVEYRVPGIRQLSVDPRHELTMARGLKTLLRMDPDVVFIGEIRDAEALEIAMRAGSSGRYVFSTLHTRDVASTITALRDLHSDPYSLSGNLTGIVSQRLIRCLCRKCCVAQPISDEERAIFQAEGLEPPAELYHPRGCDDCLNSGYRDRVGVFEAVASNAEIVAALQHEVSEDELRTVIRKTHSSSLKCDALLKARAGISSLSEARSLGWVERYREMPVDTLA